MEQSAEYVVDRTKEQLKPSHHRSWRDSHEQKQEDPTDAPQQKDRPESVEPKERPEQPQRSSESPTNREERSNEAPQRSPQAEQYQRTESAKKIIKEKHNAEQPRSHESEEHVSVREKPISEELDQTRDTDQSIDADHFRSSEPKESSPKERFNYAEEQPDPKIKEYQVKKHQECVILALCFGLFASNEATSPTQNGKPMTEAIQDVNNEFVDKINAKISRFKKKYKPDEIILIYEGDTDSKGTVMNWADVLGIYAVGTTTDPEQPTDVLIVTPDKVNILRDYFMEMNSVSYDTEVEKEEIPALDDDGEPIFDDEGEQVMETKTTLTITITVSSMDYRDAASRYNFNESQMEMLTEIMQPEYYPLFAELTGDVIGDGGEYGFGLDINPDLPPNELGYQIVQAAKRYIGRSYASMDCSCLARTAYKDCGLTSMNGLSSVRMAQKCQEMGCLFTDPSQLQAGDLIFFARFDPSRGKDYCGDVNRCGTGKCRRWLHIHHVAIYINDEYLIDSTGGDNSVQIRKHWGMNTSKWKWVCFGRPTT